MEYNYSYFLIYPSRKQRHLLCLHVWKRDLKPAADKTSSFAEPVGTFTPTDFFFQFLRINLVKQKITNKIKDKAFSGYSIN